MVEIICIVITCISFVIACVSQIILHKQKRCMERAVEDIEHFLLYPEEMQEESLEEGYMHNLMNQIIKLETQAVYDRKRYGEKEAHVNCFIENMAHQMKTSITAIQLRLDFSFVRCQDDQEKESLLKSQECLLRLTNEVERLLTASQLASGKVRMVYETICIHTMLEDCMNRFRELAEKKKVEFILKGQEKVSYCGDEFWLTQAIENVIKNAMEHTHEGTKVYISVYSKNSCVNIQIEDEGDGIPEEEIGLLFERFCRGSSRKKGYGIGLSMAKDIIQSHHGTIVAENREENGARFVITLPILSGAEAYPI